MAAELSRYTFSNFVMLFLLWGASGSGKTTVIGPIRQNLPALAVHDFDEVGVPASADKAWRHRIAEQWIQRALDYQAEGRHTLLCGQLPYGEVLACPSAPALAGLSSCLLDCEDYERIKRIRGRGGGAEAATQDMLCWAAWMRMHAHDPQWHPDVITEQGAPEMCWERWLGRQAGDPRWRVTSIDTSGSSLEATVDGIVMWIRQEQGQQEV
jgi:hypothetical protein